MAFCAQFRALFKKNFIVWYRNLCGSLCEILFPVILGLVLILIRNLVSNSTVDAKNYIGNCNFGYYYDENTALINPNPSPWMGLCPGVPFSSCIKLQRNKIAVIADDTTFGVLQNSFLNKLGVMSANKLSYERFTSEEALNSYITDENYEKTSPGICGAIVITGSTGDYDVKLKFDDNIILTKKDKSQQVPNTQLPAVNMLSRTPDETSYLLYYTSGFTYLQYAITKALAGPSINKLKIGMVPVKTDSYLNDVFLTSVGNFLGYIIVLCYLAPVFRIVSTIVQDKELKTREGMSIMGLKDSAYWLSLWVYYLIIFLFIAIILAIIMVVFIFKHTNWLLLFFFLLLYGLANFSFSFFVATFFSRSRIASITAAMLYFASYLITDLVSDETTGEGTKTAASLLPTVAAGLGTISFVNYETGQYGVSFKNATDLVSNYRFSNALLMLTADIFIYGILGLYLDNVIPTPSGVSKSLYYFLTKQYWTGKYEDKIKPLERKDSLLDKEKDQNILYPDEYFEKVGDELKIQEDNSDCLSIRFLNKFFGQKHSVCDFSVNMYTGQIFALLGPNGAGKTTTISMLSGMLPISSGKAWFNGMPIFKEMSKVREKLGMCPQHDVLFENLTPKEHLEIFAAFRGRSDTELIKKDVEEILQDIELKDSANMIVSNLSGGQRRKLSIGIAFIGRSDMIFLDEPTSGIDLAARKRVWAMLKKYKENKVIILTTHYMEEAEELGDRIGIMTSGKLRCVGAPLFLKTVYGAGYNLIIAHEETSQIQEIEEKITEFLSSRVTGISIKKSTGRDITYFMPKGQEKIFKKLFTDLDNSLKDLKISSYGMATNTLEDIFLKVAREDDREDGQKLNPNMFSESIARNANEDKAQSRLDKYTIVDEVDKSFCYKFFVHFSAVFLKRILINVRNLGTIVNEILVPIVLIIFGFALTKVNNFNDSKPRWLNLGLYYKPQRVVINENSFSDLVNTNGLTKYFDSGMIATQIPIAEATNKDALNFMDSYLNTNWNVNPFRYGSIFVNKLDGTNKEFEYTVFANLTSQDSVASYMSYFSQAILRYVTNNPNYKLTFASAPFPLTFKAKTRQQARSSNIVSVTLVVALALFPASIISFIVQEREGNLKHQQLISGVSLFAYWLSNGAMDIFKSLIPCGLAIGMIYAFDVTLGYGWVLILLYGFTIIPFTYATSFFFVKENSAQTVTLLLNFFMGVILSPVFTMFHMFENTRPIAKVLGWIFRIVPSFCLAYGVNNISYKETYARLEGATTAGKDFDFTVSGGDLFFLCILFPIYIILISMAEAGCFRCCGNCCEPKLENTKVNELNVQKHKLVAYEESACDVMDLNTNPPAILSRHIKKMYRLSSKESALAVNDVSFYINKGECLALLGTNGAGKTTTFKMITRDVDPTYGEIFINGMELKNNFTEIRKMIGYSPQYESAYNSLTVKENMDFYAKLKGIPTNIREEIIMKLIDEMDLKQYENVLFGQLSGGNKRKTTVAIALLGNPPIVLLDELSTGVDPQAKRFMWHIIQRICTKNKNTAVILTTHSMEEAEYLCTKMAIMVGGEFCCIGTPQELKEAFGKGYEIQISLPFPEESEEKQFLGKYSISFDQLLSLQEVTSLFDKVGKPELKEQLKSKGNAAHIMAEIENTNTVKAKLVANFLLIYQHAMEVARELAAEFKEVRVPEHIGNFFKFRVDKSQSHHTIGFLFGLLQDIVEKHNITQYSASQTSLNQIFQTFAKQAEVVRYNMIVWVECRKGRDGNKG